jgi:hypothetical protein
VKIIPDEEHRMTIGNSRVVAKNPIIEAHKALSVIAGR